MTCLVLGIAAAVVSASEPNHAAVPGVIIDYSPAKTGRYIGCPGIAVLPDGGYVATHSFFGPGSTYDRMCVHRSGDRGRTWTKIAEMRGQWWSTLFWHRDALYLMGVSKRYGDVVIRRSADGGRTWTDPKDARTGLLLTGAPYHCAPVPVVVHKGRIWRAMEDAKGGGGWGKHFRAFVQSAPEDADLLDASNWTATNRLARDPAWLNGAFGGWLEGNVVVTPDGELVNILRVESPKGGKAAIVHVSADGRTVTFDAEKDLIDLPGGSKKFTIRHDPKSGLYWSLTNAIRDEDRKKLKRSSLIRNTLVLVSSPDLREWTVRSTVLRHPDPRKHGFQYVGWLSDGEDIIFVSRTAYDDGVGGAHNQHDANYFTFHRLPGFRSRTMADPPLAARQ